MAEEARSAIRWRGTKSQVSISGSAGTSCAGTTGRACGCPLPPSRAQGPCGALQESGREGGLAEEGRGGPGLQRGRGGLGRTPLPRHRWCACTGTCAAASPPGAPPAPGAWPGAARPQLSGAGGAPAGLFWRLSPGSCSQGTPGVPSGRKIKAPMVRSHPEAVIYLGFGTPAIFSEQPSNVAAPLPHPSPGTPSPWKPRAQTPAHAQQVGGAAPSRP